MSKLVTKAVATIDSWDADPDSPNGSFEAILSTPDLDRDNDQLAQDEWKSLPAKIHIDLDHEMSVAGTVGSATPFFDSDGNMRIKGTYASTPRAQEVRTLVNEGHISTMSVAFMTDRSVKDGSPNRELLNGAFVAVPSNRGALVLSSKAFEVFEAERKAAKAEDDTDDTADGSGDDVDSKKKDPKKPYGDVDYADPGYLDADGKPATDGSGVSRYALNTESRARAAWSYINMPKNAGQYTAEQLSKIKDKIKAACEKFGIEIDDDKGDDSKGLSAEAILKELADLLAETKAGARNSTTDQRLIQTVHNASTLLGADCHSEPGADVDDGSSEGANKAVRSALIIGKSLNGSLEDMQCRLQCALNDATGAGNWNGSYACIRATFLNPDGKGGSVVYELGGETLCRAFADDGANVTLDPNIQVVSIVTSVAAVPDTVDGDPTPLPPAAADAAKSAPEPETKSSLDMDTFKSQLDALTGDAADTKTAGVVDPGSPESPAGVDAEPPAEPGSQAAPNGPADEPADAAGEADQAADEAESARDVQAQLIAANLRMALAS